MLLRIGDDILTDALAGYVWARICGALQQRPIFFIWMFYDRPGNRLQRSPSSHDSPRQFVASQGD